MCVCVWGLRGWSCEVGDGKFLCESFLGSVMFITRTHSCLDLIPLKNRNDLTSHTEITVQSADRHALYFVFLRLAVAEKCHEVLLP